MPTKQSPRNNSAPRLGDFWLAGHHTHTGRVLTLRGEGHQRPHLCISWTLCYTHLPLTDFSLCLFLELNHNREYTILSESFWDSLSDSMEVCRSLKWQK